MATPKNNAVQQVVNWSLLNITGARWDIVAKAMSILEIGYSSKELRAELRALLERNETYGKAQNL